MVAYASYPFQLDSKGKIQETDFSAHVEQLIKQHLFTAPGERVNRPSFGSGIMQMVFGGITEEVQAALQSHLQSSLNYWIKDYASIDHLKVIMRESTLFINIHYTLISTGESHSVELQKSYDK